MSKRTQRSKLHKYEVQRRHLPGTSPGTLLIDPKAPMSAVSVIAYSKDECVEVVGAQAESIGSMLTKYPVVWVNVCGLGDEAAIVGLGELFGLHRLAVEDVVHTHQRAKVESYEDHIYLVARNALLDEETLHIETEQVSVFLGNSWVLTFQECVSDRFEPVRDRIKAAKGRMRIGGTDYLAYALLDSIIDHYFPVLETLGEKLEDIEDATLSAQGEQTITRINDVRRSLVTLRRACWPLREAINSLMRDPTTLISDETDIYLRDCYDHTIGVIDLIESYREVASGLIDMYLSSVSNRMNEVMKVLTMIATIFMPLSFFAGLYGMNFNTDVSPFNMPELNWFFGYPFVLTIMLSTSLGMLTLFWRRGWLGKRGKRSQQAPVDDPEQKL